MVVWNAKKNESWNVCGIIYRYVAYKDELCIVQTLNNCIFWHILTFRKLQTSISVIVLFLSELCS